MFELESNPHYFPNPTHENWIPSPDSLFEFDEELEEYPSAAEIKLQCQQIHLDWDLRERVIRRLRSQMAIELGVCRNH